MAPKPIDWPVELRALRVRRGWSQADLALAIGARENTVWRYEAGKHVPNGLYRAALLALLDDLDAEDAAG